MTFYEVCPDCGQRIADDKWVNDYWCPHCGALDRLRYQLHDLPEAPLKDEATIRRELEAAKR